MCITYLPFRNIPLSCVHDRIWFPPNYNDRLSFALLPYRRQWPRRLPQDRQLAYSRVNNIVLDHKNHPARRALKASGGAVFVPPARRSPPPPAGQGGGPTGAHQGVSGRPTRGVVTRGVPCHARVMDRTHFVTRARRGLWEVLRQGS